METIDLRSDNRVYELLDIIEAQKDIISDAVSLKTEAEKELKDKIGTATRALVNGWQLEWRTRVRKECIIPAGESHHLYIRRRKNRI